jgi:hypothetical protein
MSLNLKNVLVGLLLAGLTTGCTLSRKTTTSRTAVEQALLSRAAERTLEALEIPPMEGYTFTISAESFRAVDGEFILAALNEKLLKAGMLNAQEPDEAAIVVYPRVAHAAVDDSGFSFGLPSVSIPVPSVGQLRTPEISLFGIDRQVGRNRMGLHGVYQDTGQLALSVPPANGQATFTRWTIFFFFNFHTSTLQPSYPRIGIW